MRTDLDRNCWYTYQPDWLAPDEADAVFEQLMDETPWIQRPIVVFGKEVMQPRLMDWSGDIPYRYSGQVLEPRDHTPLVADLNARAGAASDETFNHVLLNLYRDGKDSIAMHADNELELGWEPVIASLSLGAKRTFVIQHRKKRSWRRKVELEHGSLLVMGGAFQRRWRHGVPRRAAVTEPRVNVTFRRLFGPPGWRPPKQAWQTDDQGAS